MLKPLVFEHLPQGAENAISLRDLSAKLGIPERNLRAQIVKELEAGYPCLSSCSCHGGYFRPSEGEKGRAEMERFYNQERHRAKSTFRKLRSVKKALAQCYGQINIDEGAHKQ